MSGIVVLLNLAGAVALLLWATRMVRTGVERAYGDVLRNRLAPALRNPFLAVLGGALLAIALQSATAVTLLVASFSGAGVVGGAAGLLAVLGADLGSALVVKMLSFDLTLLVPLCILTGTTIFLSTERRTWRQFGRIIVGVGLLILSLRLIGEASEPLRESGLLPVIVNYLSSDPATAFLLAGIMTWLFHSSVAAILLIATLAARGLVPAELGLVLVLGANLGAGAIAVLLSRGAVPAARVVPIGNLLMRGTGAGLALTAFVLLDPGVAWLGILPAEQVVHAHIAFNAALVLSGLVLAPLGSRLAARIASLSAPAPDTAAVESVELSALDEAALDTPGQALSNATREVVRVCETVEIMLSEVIELYRHPTQARIDRLSALDDRVDRWHGAIKLYLARVTSRPLSQSEGLRCQELIGACIKLEQVGDIIVRNLLAHVQKKLDRKLEFTEDGWRELTGFHASVLANARLAFNVLISRDRETALQLVQEKDRLRDREKLSTQGHFERLRDGTARSVETSSIHLDTIRDLKQINSLLASIAYPVLEEQGLLRGSRLRAS